MPSTEKWPTARRPYNAASAVTLERRGVRENATMRFVVVYTRSKLFTNICTHESTLDDQSLGVCEVSYNYVTKYGSTLYIGMDEVFAQYAYTFENSDLHFHFQ